MGELSYNHNSKFNKKDITGYCVNCYERSLFRATYDKHTVSQYSFTSGKDDLSINTERGVIFTSFTCTRCLFTRRYKKKGFKASDLEGQILIKKLKLENKLTRIALRLYKFFIKGSFRRNRFDFRILRGR